MLVRKCISGEKSDIVLSNHNYGGRQIKAKWNNEEFGYFNTITKIANALYFARCLCLGYKIVLNTVAILLSGVITWQVCNNTCPVFKIVKA